MATRKQKWRLGNCLNINRCVVRLLSEKIGFNDSAELVLHETQKPSNEVDSEDRRNPLRQPTPAQYLQCFLEVVVNAGVVPVVDDFLDVRQQEEN